MKEQSNESQNKRNSPSAQGQPGFNWPAPLKALVCCLADVGSEGVCLAKRNRISGIPILPLLIAFSTIAAVNESSRVLRAEQTQSSCHGRPGSTCQVALAGTRFWPAAAKAR